jgi:2-dehydro-3-deoxy-D-arabinonate dehydratase
MKLCQFHSPKDGKRVGVVVDDGVIDITSRATKVTSVLDLITQGKNAAGVERLARRLMKGKRPDVTLAELDGAPSPRRAHLQAPVDAPEIWGAGITYRRSADYYTAHQGRAKGIYDHVYESVRPELFFKATMTRAVGPNAPIGIRRDSSLTAVEPELALVIGAGGAIVGYTAGNDVSAWDIERANPLYLPQSKIFTGCFAFGPVLVTAGELTDPHALALRCTITRGGHRLYEGKVSTGEMKRRCAELVDWLTRDNPIPAGTVLSTGTGILVPDEHALADGDLVEIELERVGVLRNPVRKLR